jgi:glycosyltransferase involved in cell wall biosynthesis
MSTHSGHIPIVSVLMSAHNAESSIREAVQSILNQTFTDFEFIIINDGSTDGTGNLLASLADQRIVLIHQENNGLTRALNRGLSLARGEFIARMDADDIALPERLEKQTAFLRAHPETALFASSCHGIDKNGTVLWTNSLPTTDVQIKWRLLFHNCIPHSTVMFRKITVQELGGYNNAITYAQDYDLWLRVAEHCGLAGAPEPLTSYRIPVQGAISHDHAGLQQHMVEQIQRRFYEKLNPRIAGSYEDIQELGRFLFFNGSLRDIDASARLLEDLLSAFGNSCLAAHSGPQELQALRIQPYTELAWAYFNRGAAKEFRQYLHVVLNSGYRGIFATPGRHLQEEEAHVIAAEESYVPDKESSSRTLPMQQDILAEQCLYFAWQYYARGDMKNFRRAVGRACARKPSVRIIFLWLKSLLGKPCMDRLHAVKQSLRHLLGHYQA